MRALIIATSIAAAATISLPAYAVSERFTLDVTVTQENVSTPEKTRATYEELVDKIADTCRAESGTRGIINWYSQNRCEAQTLASAIVALDEPALSALYQETTQMN